MSDDDNSPIVESYKSPTEMFKGRLVQLLYENISHNSKSRSNPAEKHAFAMKTRDLSILLERYTPGETKKEVRDWYAQLEKEIKDVKEAKDLSVTQDKREEKILALQYRYALEVHMSNQRVITNSPIIDVDIEGELDVTDAEMIDVVRRGKRQDDGTLNYKS